MLIKHCTADRYFDFNRQNFSFKKVTKQDSYEGKLFWVGGRKYVLSIEESSLTFQSASFCVDVKKFDFVYHETTVQSILEIVSASNKIKITKLKSIWEMLNLSTYDYLDKIADNHLFYAYDLIREFKKISTEVEFKKYLSAF